MAEQRTVTLDLTPDEASALLALATKGRVFLDVDPAFLAAHARRRAARDAFMRLRMAARRATVTGVAA